jgi:hypothetical protein
MTVRTAFAAYRLLLFAYLMNWEKIEDELVAGGRIELPT